MKTKQRKGLSPLAQILKRNRLQQKDVAEAVGVSRMAVLGWFHGRTFPAGAHLVLLVAFLRRFEPGVGADFLLSQVPLPRVMSGRGTPTPDAVPVPGGK